MPRDGSGVYSAPSGTLAVSTTVIDSTAYNAFVSDLTTLANEARPVSAGGTGQTSVAGVQGAFNIAPANAAATISGDWTFTGAVDLTGATVTGIAASAPPDADYGDITVSGGVWNIDAGAVGTPELADEAVTLAKLQHIATSSFMGRTTAGTGDPEVLTAAQARAILGSEVQTTTSAVTTTSGQTVTLATGLSGVSRFIVFFNSLSLSGATDSVLVQLGTSGGFVTSGYVSESAFGTAVSSDTAGFMQRILGSSREVIGAMEFWHLGGNLWRSSHAANYGIGGGFVTLGGELTQIRLQVSGVPTDSFDNGSAQVVYWSA